MNILFVTGSLFAGHDGVADYTLRLAAALRERGHGIRILSWQEVTLQAPKIKPESLCIPAHLPIRAKLAHARHFLAGFTPDIVSLQFVPYAFDPRGFPVSLARELAPLIGNLPLHIFAHELWVLPFMRTPWAYRILGPTAQRAVLLQALRELKPACVHTSLPLYQNLLQKEGLPMGQLLPLPGNIPLRELSRAPHPAHHERNVRHLGFFGSIFDSAPLEDFCKHLVELQLATGLSLTLTSAGNLSNSNIRRWKKLTRRFGHVIHFERLGHLAVREASYYLQSLDFLISAYSPTFWMKSGTIAAAREFGKPVILTAPPELPENAPLPEGLTTQLTPELLKTPPSPTPYSPIETLADKFLADITPLIK